MIDAETRTVNAPTSYSGDLDVGASGTGTLSIQNGGAVSNRNGTVAHYVGSTGTVSVTGPGSTWTNTNELVVGWSGRGAMTVSDSGRVVAISNGFIGARDGGSGQVTVTGSGSTWNIGSQLVIGLGASTGDLLVENGGTVINTSGRIGLSANSVGTVTITGANSTLTDNGPILRIGYDGTGTLTVADGGLVTVGTQTNGVYNGTLTIASNAGSAGTLNIGAAAGSNAATAGTFKAASIAFGNGTGTIVFNHTSNNYALSSAITTQSNASVGTIRALAGNTTLNGNVSGQIDLALLGGSMTLGSASYAGRSISVSPGTTLTLASGAPITLSGGYTQTGGALIFNPANKLVLTGTNAATVTNTAIALAGTNLTTGTYTLVDTNVAGTYADNTIRVTGTRGLSGTLSTADNGHDLIATLSQTNYTGKGITAGGAATSLGAALDAIDLSSSTDPVTINFQSKVIDTLAQLPVPQQQQAIKQLAPIQATPAAQTAQAAAPTTSVIEQHELALLGNGGSGETGMAAGSAPLGYGLWGQVIGGGALRNTANQVDGYRSRSFGLVAGVDHLLDDGGVIGLATSWTKGWNWGSDGAAGTFATMNSYQLTGYGLHRFGMAFLDWQLGVGYNQFSQTRAISFLNQQAKADFDGQQYLVKVGGGHDFAIGGQTTLTPLASLRFLRAVSDGYSESGSDANLTIERRGVQSLTHDLGGKVSWKFSSDIGQITPEVRLAWEHDYTQGPIASSGLIGGQSFTSTTARPSPDGAKLNLAVTLDTADNMSLRAEYEGDMRADYQSHTGLVKATWEF